MIDRDVIESIRQSAEAAKATAEACLQVVKLLERAEQENQYVPIEDASKLLGVGISPEMLKDRCIDGRFKYGKHFINTSDGRRGNYLIKVAAVRQFFETDPSKRSPAR